MKKINKIVQEHPFSKAWFSNEYLIEDIFFREHPFENTAIQTHHFSITLYSKDNIIQRDSLFRMIEFSNNIISSVYSFERVILRIQYFREHPFRIQFFRAQYFRTPTSQKINSFNMFLFHYVPFKIRSLQIIQW